MGKTKKGPMETLLTKRIGSADPNAIATSLFSAIEKFLVKSGFPVPKDSLGRVNAVTLFSLSTTASAIGVHPIPSDDLAAAFVADPQMRAFRLPLRRLMGTKKRSAQ